LRSESRSSGAKRNPLVDCPEQPDLLRAFPDMRCADDGTKLGKRSR
jgi:hypothetical protein